MLISAYSCTQITNENKFLYLTPSGFSLGQCQILINPTEKTTSFLFHCILHNSESPLEKRNSFSHYTHSNPHTSRLRCQYFHFFSFFLSFFFLLLRGQQIICGVFTYNLSCNSYRRDLLSAHSYSRHTILVLLYIYIYICVCCHCQPDTSFI